jgi:hypothetical protein
VEELHVQLVVFHDQHGLCHDGDPVATLAAGDDDVAVPAGKLGANSFGKANSMPEKRGLLTHEEAEIIAIGGLAFLAERPEALARFLSMAGLAPETLRSAAAEPGFPAGVIAHFLSDEALLVDYAKSAGISPERIAAAGRLLVGE